MADEDHAALELSDGIGESVYRLHVQVVGRFVQQQQVRSLPGQIGKHDSTPLSVTQLSDGTHLQSTSGIRLSCQVTIFMEDTQLTLDRGCTVNLGQVQEQRLEQIT